MVLSANINHNDIIEAYKRIRPYTKNTPVLQSRLLNKLTNTNIYFKCENFQSVGAFKFRGANNAIRLLNNSILGRGVATHSSGNHGQAVALVAKQIGIPAYIVMPNNAPDIKVEAIRSYGAMIKFCEPTLEARESTLNQLIATTNANFIHPYNDLNVIAGQGTVAYEFIQKIHHLDIIIAPVGGGGLLSGTSLIAKHLKPSITVIGAEPSGADDAFRSKETGKIQKHSQPDTICDGLRTSLGSNTFSIISRFTDKIHLVEDAYTIEAMKLIWERMKIIVEPSACIGLGAVLKNKEYYHNKNIGIILTGGNLDLSKLPF
ncbi:MAG TPA: pyridoxal-phosphate dependent enzyme [Candidatus Kapabacteria bacterium]|nr:pyridoxal-phosphate dependent enzyme [Candidatus Kapabacteria bacterium]